MIPKTIAVPVRPTLVSVAEALALWTRTTGKRHPQIVLSPEWFWHYDVEYPPTYLRKFLQAHFDVDVECDTTLATGAWGIREYKIGVHAAPIDILVEPE